jgi:hypothetical protein
LDVIALDPFSLPLSPTVYQSAKLNGVFGALRDVAPRITNPRGGAFGLPSRGRPEDRDELHLSTTWARHKMPAPRRKGLSRGNRLTLAKPWVPTYSGRSLIRGYATWFGVSEVCAIVELRMLGVDVPDALLQQARRSEQARAAMRAGRKQPQASEDGWPDSGEEFAFIAGYTPGGIPYGIAREDANTGRGPARAPGGEMDDTDDDLPF